MIERTRDKIPYTPVWNRILRSGTLDLDELGLYVLMLSYPDNWDFYEHNLAKELGLPDTEIRRLLNRLRQKGFVRMRRGRYGTTWDLIESGEPAGEPEEPDAKEKPEAKRLTNEEMALNFFALAEKMRKENLKNRIAREQACRSGRNGV